MVCDYLEGWDGMGGGKEVQEGGGIWIDTADLCWCMAETNTILQINYPPNKNKLIKKLRAAEMINIWVNIKD